MKPIHPAVIGYLRVSTEEQAVSGLGLADQRAIIAAEAGRRGWNNVSYVSDEGYSAKNLSRPGISEALTSLARGESNTLVVAKLDRLSRSLLDFATLMDRARHERWELVVLDIAIDTTTPSGALMANVMAAFAEYERQLIGARTTAALAQLKLQGRRLGRPRTLNRAVVKRILDARRAGQSVSGIAGDLNSDAVPTARGGARWYPSTVRAVLASELLDAELPDLTFGSASAPREREPHIRRTGT